MVVVRESPRAHLSPEKNPAQWPPRSPFQALLSSPGGRRKWEDRQQSRAGATSPSPTSTRSRRQQHMVDVSGEDDDEDDLEDEDEETLQLQLQEIQAKLKLKKLQSAKKSSGSSETSRESRHDSVRSSSPTKSPRRPISPTTLYRSAVEVPLSPIRNARPPQEQLSPARQRLGLTSVPRAQDVSLKRARDGAQIKRQRSQPSLQSSESLSRPKSFSERLAETKTEAVERQAKKDRLGELRSDGFGHTRSDISTPTPTSRASKLATESLKRPSSAGRAFDAPAAKRGPVSQRSVSVQEPKSSKQQPQPNPAQPKFNPGAYGQDSGTGHAESEDDSTLHVEKVDEEAGYDPFSKIHLSKRHISHAVVAREMEGKQIYSLPRLLKEVKSPDYEPPDCESDYVVFAVLASKSSPLDHTQTHRTAEKGKDDFQAPQNKFMVLHLCDLKWEIDVFLFGTAFNQFWKLTPGTLLAILNPAILPPKGNQHSGKFSLKLGSSEDAVMEIGVARDLGYCSAVKKDGQKCDDWIDKRKTEACEFHINLLVERSRKERMEVNTMFRGAGDAKDRHKSRVAREGRGGKQGGGRYDRVHGQLYTVTTGMGKSVASLLDAEDTDALHNMTQEEASRKRIANAQRERDLAKNLAEMGKGPGAEYLRVKHSQTTTTTSSSRPDSAAETARKELFAKPSAADLGLLGKKASEARLSPAKDRKRHFGLGALSMTTSSKTPMGWGGARKAGLLQRKNSRMGSPEREQTTLENNLNSTLVRPRSQDTAHSSIRSAGSSSPVKKKARFVLERGIREPGRDSLPGGVDAMIDDDDDDDLDIIS